MYVVPKPGLTVIDPQSFQPLPPNGANVGGSASHWERQRLHGDVSVFADEAAYVAASKKAPSQKT